MNQLDIIIPVKNEASNIRILVERIHAAMTGAKVPYSMIFIDDHSTDATSSILADIATKYPLIFSRKKREAWKGL